MRKLIFLSLLIILIPFAFAQWKIVGSTVTFDKAGYKLGINTENANASLDVNATWARISGLRVHTLIVDNQSCLGGPNNCITNWSQIGGGGGGGGVWGQSNNNIYYTAGNVGIGTTTPNHSLEVYSNTGSAFIQAYGVGDTWNFAGINLKSDENIDKVWQITHRKEAGNTNKLIISYYNGSWWFQRLTIDAAGNVGIGTTNPSQKLSVAGGASIGYISGSKKGIFINNEDAYGNLPVIQGVTSGWGAEGIAINPVGGNVGIGTTSPRAKLHVAGDAYFEGKVIFGYETNVESCSGYLCIASCSSGKKVISGGCGSGSNGIITYSGFGRYLDSWMCISSKTDDTITVTAICARVE
ncbi:MAG: hypothetical protein QW244_00525 [Candidatus Pacearchaeota archaeon]